jgi:hypothetical protein
MLWLMELTVGRQFIHSIRNDTLVRVWLLDTRTVKVLWAFEKWRKYDLYDKISDIQNYSASQ